MIIGDVLPVMVDDALISSHPIIFDVSTPAEITSVFDSISYSKVPALSKVHTSAHTGAQTRHTDGLVGHNVFEPAGTLRTTRTSRVFALRATYSHLDHLKATIRLKPPRTSQNQKSV